MEHPIFDDGTFVLGTVSDECVVSDVHSGVDVSYEGAKVVDFEIDSYAGLAVVGAEVQLLQEWIIVRVDSGVYKCASTAW